MKKLIWVFLGMGLVVLVGEGAFRLGVVLGSASFKNPGLYADWTSDDDYWKLRHLWGRKVSPESKEPLDPFLGWVVPKSPTNPLGAAMDKTEKSQPIEYERPNILFFGDSFVQGQGDFSKRLPQQLAAIMPGVPVHNLGVRGYGVDQIYLRTLQISHSFKRPAWVIGLLTVDLDRSVLRFRTGPKPYFELPAGKLEVRGVPMEPDADRFLKNSPPEIDSYLFAFLKRRWTLLLAKGNELELTEGRDLKKEINAKILGELVSEARTRGIPLVFSLFYNREELSYVGWREKFLKEQLTHLGASFVDSKELLLSSAKASGASLEAFYLPEGHLNEKGNEIVARAIARHFRPTSSPSTVGSGTRLN